MEIETHEPRVKRARLTDHQPTARPLVSRERLQVSVHLHRRFYEPLVERREHGGQTVDIRVCQHGIELRFECSVS